MADPTRAEPRNPTVGGETAQDSVDRMAGGTKGAVPPSVTRAPVVNRPAPVNVHPSAKGVYGAPVGDTILK